MSKMKWKPDQRKEDALHKSVAQLLDVLIPGKWFHPPNGGKRSKAEAGIFKSLGVKKGVPDVFIEVPRGGFHGMRVELKTRYNKPTPEQRTWLAYYNGNGYYAIWANSFDEVEAAVKAYLNGKITNNGNGEIPYTQGVPSDRRYQPD